VKLLRALPAVLVLALGWHGVLRARPPLVPAVGSPEFVAATREALLKLRPTAQYAAVLKYVAEIREHKCSGMNVYGEKPSYEVGKPTWSAGALWYAGTIAHDAHHSRLYFEEKARLGGAEPDALVWTGAEAEKKCLKVQHDALRAMGAGDATLAYIVELSSAPTYQNVGADLPDPCDKRDW
jgi:hypothetical protein